MVLVVMVRGIENLIQFHVAKRTAGTHFDEAGRPAKSQATRADRNLSR